MQAHPKRSAPILALLEHSNPFIQQGWIKPRPSDPKYRYIAPDRKIDSTDQKRHRARLRSLQFYVIENHGGFLTLAETETGEVFVWVPAAHLKPVKGGAR